MNTALSTRLNVFSEAFNPEDILHRGQQQEEIAKTFNNFHGNLLLSGNSGTGKTTTLKYIMKRNLGNYLYYSPTGKTTSIRLIKNLSNLKTTRYNVISDFIEMLVNNPKILIIDEIDKVTDVDVLFNILNAVYRQTNVPIIIVSTNQKIFQKMPDDARRTLFFQRIAFGAYDAIELRDIAQARLGILNGQGYFPEEALARICAICTQNGSAREVLFMVHECLVADRYSSEFIDTLVKKVENEDWLQWYNGLNPTQRKIIECIADHQLNYPEKKIKSSEIQRITEIKQPTVSSTLTKIEDSTSAIISEYENKGRGGGKIRYVRLDSNLLKAIEMERE